MLNQTWSAAALMAVVGVQVSASDSRPWSETGVITGPIGAAATHSDRSGLDHVDVDVAGIQSWDALGSPNNVVVNIWVGPFNEVNGIGWDVVLQTVIATSWRSEMSVRVSNSAVDGVGGFTPGVPDPSPGGPTQYQSNGNGDILKLANYGVPNIVALADGIIRLEFFDSYDDAQGQVDGEWVSGIVRFQTLRPIPPIPTAGTLGLLTTVGIGCMRRKRADELRFSRGAVSLR